MWVQIPLSSTMKIKNNIIKDFNKRKLYNSFEYPNLFIKTLINNKILKIKQKTTLNNLLHTSFNYNTKPRNLCIFSNRTRGNFIKYKINRTHFKNLINDAKLPGVKNASW